MGCLKFPSLMAITKDILRWHLGLFEKIIAALMTGSPCLGALNFGERINSG